MIGWLQKVLQKHYKWLFIGLLGVIIISFVFTIGSAPGISTGKSMKAKNYYGYNLNDKVTANNLLLNANISSLTNIGQTIPNERLAQDQALIRPPLLFLAKSLELPDPSEKTFTTYFQKKPIFLNKEGQFDPKLYEQFLNYVKENPSFHQGRVRQVAMEDYKIDEVLKTIAGPGYVLPYEVNLIFKLQNIHWSVDVATADLSTKEGASSVNDNDLTTFYNDHLETFRQPELLKLSYIQFQKKDFESAVKAPSDEELETFYNNNSSLFAKENEKIPSFNEVNKEDLLKKYNYAKAGQLALETANNFTYELYDRDIGYRSQEFIDALKKNKVQLQHFEPLSAKTIAQEKEPMQQVLKDVSSLDNARYYSNPTATANDVYVVFFEEKIPSTIPPITEVKENVKTAFLAARAKKLRLEKIKAIENAFLKTQANEQSFAEIAKANGLIIQSYNDFLLRKLPEGFPQIIVSQVFNLSQGGTSQFIVSDDKGFIAYVHSKTFPTVDENSADYKELMQQLTTFNSSATADSLIQEMVEKELGGK